MSQPQGHYPIERLHTQSAALEPDAAIMREQIGVAPGWRCLDLGCGPGGIIASGCARKSTKAI